MVGIDSPGLLIAKSQHLSPKGHPAAVISVSILAFVGGLLTILSPRILPLLPFVVARLGQPFRRSVLPMPVGMAAKTGLCLHILLSLESRFGALNLALMDGQTTSSLL